jgi:transcriptional regulator with XRE-family HTH domain
MKELSKEQIEYAIGRLQKLVEFRTLSQTQLEQLSGVNQSTISKIFSRAQDPSAEVLKRLFQAIGLKLADVLYETDSLAHELYGYLATPLTNIVRDGAAEDGLRDVVARIKKVAAGSEFASPRFDTVVQLVQNAPRSQHPHDRRLPRACRHLASEPLEAGVAVFFLAVVARFITRHSDALQEIGSRFLQENDGLRCFQLCEEEAFLSPFSRPPLEEFQRRACHARITLPLPRLYAASASFRGKRYRYSRQRCVCRCHSTVAGTIMRSVEAMRNPNSRLCIRGRKPHSDKRTSQDLGV